MFSNIQKVFYINQIIITGNIIGDDEIFLNKIYETWKSFGNEDSKSITYIKDLSASFGVARLALINKIESGAGL
jgi:hypothetical protein